MLSQELVYCFFKFFRKIQNCVDLDYGCAPSFFYSQKSANCFFFIFQEKKYKNTVDLDYEGAPSFFSLQNQ